MVRQYHPIPIALRLEAIALSLWYPFSELFRMPFEVPPQVAPAAKAVAKARIRRPPG